MKINKKSKFNQFMDGWVKFSDGSYVLSAELYETKQDALAKLIEEFGDYPSDHFFLDFKEDEIEPNRVRYCCQGTDDAWDGPACCWWLNASGRGSKPVWVYRLKRKFPQAVFLD